MKRFGDFVLKQTVVVDNWVLETMSLYLAQFLQGNRGPITHSAWIDDMKNSKRENLVLRAIIWYQSKINPTLNMRGRQCCK